MASAYAPAVAAPRSIGNAIAAYPSPSCTLRPAAASSGVRNRQRLPTATACVQPPSASHGAVTRLYVSGLSFRTTEESLRDAFEKFVNLVMDRVAKRPRGFAFLSYADELEAKDAMEGMHGKFLDGRVIFVEVANRRSGF
ncbi:organelle RRM domain-containing protein 6, chloroplastic isoform X2 [Phragmites australis]|uniref:organelle RRM domain-containing protein 6, chloroplastic isoform X2 n=1 Tax=Phragmites australis TaxID=29695 RepID=UPI002D798AFA|nr:organelle RRM domain-containing protein 6, chloroplastic isoform X2 [Phragmites australis]